MSEVFITSDIHFCHDKSFLYEPRGFESVWEMNEAIIERWNKVISYDDDVYVLGDLMLNDVDTGMRLLKQLNGNLHIALGNHDIGERPQLYADCYNVKEISYAYPLRFGKMRFYATHYPSLVSNFDDEKAPSKAVWNLCGHTHTNNMWADIDKGRIVHVEMDTNNCTPWNIDEVIERVKACKKF